MRIIEAVLDIGERLRLDGQVMYPAGEEMVVAFARHREALARRFRVPTPSFDTVKWAWHKRNTYSLARNLGIPSPRTWHPRDGDRRLAVGHQAGDQRALHLRDEGEGVARRHAGGPRAAVREESCLLPPGEIMVQEFVRGDGRTHLAYCAFFKDGAAVGSRVARRLHPFGFRRPYTRCAPVPPRLRYGDLARVPYMTASRSMHCSFRPHAGVDTGHSSTGV